MTQKKKFRLIVLSGIIIVFVILVLSTLFNVNPVAEKLPKPPNYRRLTDPVAKQISRAIIKVKEKPTSDNLGQLAKVYHSNTFYKEAKECYLLAISSNPDEWSWYYYLGYLSSELGETENAVKYFSKAVELNPGALYTTYYLAEALVKQGNTEQAEKLFRDLVASKATDFKPGEEIQNNLYPLKVYAQLSLARLLITSAKRDSGEVILHSLIKDYPEYGPAYRLLANSYSQQGSEDLSTMNNQLANELCQFIPLVDPYIAQLTMLSRSDEYILKQIDLAGFTGNQKWAKKLLEHATLFMPDNPYLISKAIQMYLLYGFGEEINSKIDRHFNAFANDFSELAKFAALFNKNGKYGWALMYYERCSKLKPEDITILHNLGINYCNVGDFAKAKIIIEKLIKLQPESLKTLTDVATLFIRMGEKNQALQMIQKIEKLSPNDAVSTKLKAEIALQEGNSRSADQLYLSFLLKVPDDLEAIRYIGKRLLEEKAWNKAFTHFKKALDYYPNNPEFLEQLGSLFFTCPDTRLKNLGQARYFLERAYNSIKSSNETRISAGKNLAEVYAEDKNWNKAISVINTTRILALKANIPDKEIQAMVKMTMEYMSKSKN